MSNRILAAALALLTAAPAIAVAQSSNVNVAVEAGGRSVCISASIQRHTNNVAVIDQDCERNHAGLTQVGDGVNAGAIIQEGDTNNARIRQRGSSRR